MKQWMIWVGAAVVGVILAFLLIPWGSLTIDSPDPMPTVTTPRSAGSAAVTREVDDPPDDPANVAVDEPDPDIGLPPGDAPDVTPGSEPGDEVTWTNPAREERAERMAQPDVTLARNAASRWRSLVRTIESLPHDGAADHTMTRIESLREDLQAYRRAPDDYDMDELIDRQRSIFSELKQTSYWTPEVQRTEAQLTQVMETYAAEMNAPE